MLLDFFYPHLTRRRTQVTTRFNSPITRHPVRELKTSPVMDIIIIPTRIAQTDFHDYKYPTNEFCFSTSIIIQTFSSQGINCRCLHDILYYLSVSSIRLTHCIRLG